MLEDAGNRVREPEPNGVQGLATELRGSWIVESFAAIDGIADQGMAQGLHVQPNLVGPTGSKAAFEQGRSNEAPRHLETRQGRTSGGDHGHARAMSRIASDGRAYFAVQLDHPVHEGEVVARHPSGPKLSKQPGVRSQGLRHREKSAGVLVEAVHDA